MMAKAWKDKMQDMMFIITQVNEYTHINWCFSDLDIILPQYKYICRSGSFNPKMRGLREILIIALNEISFIRS